MAWNQWYAFKSYLRGSLWIVPFIALLLEQVTFRGIQALDAKTHVDSSLAPRRVRNPDGAANHYHA